MSPPDHNYISSKYAHQFQVQWNGTSPKLNNEVDRRIRLGGAG